MKRPISLFSLIAAIVVYLVLMATPVLAFGDEHRNNHMGTGNGEGDQVQNQNQNQEQVHIGD